MRLNSLEISGADLSALCRVIITKLGFSNQGPLTVSSLTSTLVTMKRLAVDEEITFLTTTALDTISFVTLGTTSHLAGERVLTAGTGMTITDGGAGSTVTVTFGPLTSLQLSSALSDETGSGSAVFATSPSLTTATLNTYTTIVQGSAPTPTTDKLYNVSGNLLFNGINLTAGGALPVGTEGQMMYSNAGVWTAFSGLLWDDTSKYLTVERTGLTTDAIYSGIVVRSVKTTNMGDGFGTGLRFDIQDDAGVANDIGYIRFIRAGADDKGSFKITLNNSGYVDVILISPAGVVNIPNLTASQIMATDASKNLTNITDLPTATTIGSAYVYRVGGTDIAVADGGTNISSYTIGDLLYASTTGVLSKLADVATGAYLASGGVGVAPAWATLNQAAVAGLKATESPIFVTVKLSGLTDGYIPVHTSDAVGFENGPLKTDVDDAVTKKHVAVTVSAPISLSGQALSLVNNAGSPATVTTIDTDGTLAGNSDVYIPTQKAVKTYVDTEVAEFMGLFEIDINGDLEPVTESITDQYYELDGSDDIMPKAA